MRMCHTCGHPVDPEPIEADEFIGFMRKPENASTETVVFVTGEEPDRISGHMLVHVGPTGSWHGLIGELQRASGLHLFMEVTCFMPLTPEQLGRYTLLSDPGEMGEFVEGDPTPSGLYINIYPGNNVFRRLKKRRFTRGAPSPPWCPTNLHPAPYFVRRM